MHRVHLVIQGRVQGVGFRYYVYRQATTLGLLGWVRNLPGGAVELEAEGTAAALRDFVSAVREGPTGARIAEVSEEWTESPTRHHRFAIL